LTSNLSLKRLTDGQTANELMGELGVATVTIDTAGIELGGSPI